MAACPAPALVYPARAANHVWAYDFVFDACANGPQFVSLAILKWLTENSVETVHIDPGKPW